MNLNLDVEEDRKAALEVPIVQKQLKETADQKHPKKKRTIEDYENEIGGYGTEESYADGYIVLKTIYSDEHGFIWDLYQRKEEWDEIDNLVATYQKGILAEKGTKEKMDGNDAASTLISRFYPLFRKYLLVIKTGQINFKNPEQKQFVKLFIPEVSLRGAMSKKKIGNSAKEAIRNRFSFISEGYGKQETEEILADLHMLFLTLARRYKPMGRSFACYLYNVYRYEVARHIMKYNRNPANFQYKNICLDDAEPQQFFDDYDKIDDAICEDGSGLPDKSWIKGETCSDMFSCMSPIDRLILSKYYLQNWNDGQIGMLLGMHTNTVNIKRKAILQRFCDKIGRDPEEVKRYRRPGVKNALPAWMISQF